MAVGTRSSIQRDAGRLPRVPGGPVNRGREIRIGLLGVLGILVLVIGIPVALILLVGYPLPRSAPSRDWLTESITATLIIKILACVVWIVWAHFTACIIAEWRAVRRGRLPGDLPLGGGSQQLARRLVAAALLLSGMATIAHSAAGADTHRPAHVATARTVTPAAVGQSAPAGDRTGAHRSTEAAAAEAQSEAGKYYVVQPPHGRRYDSLWDIAERTLRDPRRYHEIFELNKDRVQADGRKLVDANLIMPGWDLRLPADASGPGVRRTHVAPVVPSTPAPAPASTGAPAGGAAASVTPAAGSQRMGGAATTPTAAPDHGVTPGLPVGGGLVLAGVLLALSSRRGPFGLAADDLATLADTGLAARLDRQLRALAEARTAQGRELPAPVIAWVDAEHVRLVLAGGDLADPPAPWRSHGEHDWLLAPGEDAQPSPDTAAPFPALLGLGRREPDGAEVFADLEQAPGVIAVAGAPERAREFAAALAVQAATCVWSDGAQVTMVGFAGGAELAPFAPHAIRYADRLGDVLAGVEADRADAVRLQQQLGVGGVLSGRQRRRDDAWRPHLLVLSGPPAPAELSRLAQLVAGGSNIIVVVLGDVPEAAWRFVIDADGRLDLGALGSTVQAHRLTPTSRGRLVAELEDAARERPRRTAEVAALTPVAAVSELAAPVHGRRDVPVAAEVSVLGPVQVTAPGPLPEAQRDLATEIIVAVALHPQGIHEAVLRASVWPRGVSDDVFAAGVQVAAAWLGPGRDGQPLLAAHPDGRWRLGAGVRLDWDELRVQVAGAVGESERPALAAAMELVRGEAFSGTPAGRYRWLAFARSARDARVVGTAVARRLAALLVGQRRPAEAVEVLRRGLRLVPTSELLWRDLLTISSWDGPDGAAAAAVEMYATLRAHRIWPEPETDALVAQVAPGYGGTDPSPAGPAVAVG